MNTQTMDRRKWRKLITGLVVGMIAGAAGAAGMLSFVEGGAFGRLANARLAALLVALVYLLMGAAVLVGAAAPGVGSKFLNVEDADELRDERSTILPSGLSCVALAVGLAALALAGDRFAPEFAASVFGIGVAIAVALSRTVMTRADELMRGVMREAGAASYYLSFAVIGGWAVLAHLDFVAAPAMLTIVTLFYVLTLLASFLAIGRRGMLMPR